MTIDSNTRGSVEDSLIALPSANGPLTCAPEDGDNRRILVAALTAPLARISS